MTRSFLRLSLAVAFLIAAPAAVEAQSSRHEVLVIEPTPVTPAVVEVSRSTAMLPFGLSAVRLRSGSRNRSDVG